MELHAQLCRVSRRVAMAAKTEKNFSVFERVLLTVGLHVLIISVALLGYAHG